MALETNVNWSSYVREAASKLGETYEGRPLILPDTPIQGGVLYYGTPGEAVIVDPTDHADVDYTDVYEMLYENSLRRARVGGVLYQDRIPRAIAVTAMSSLRYNMAKTRKLVAQFAQERGYETPPKGMPVNLGYFLHQGFGVCRHIAPATGWLYERYIQEELVPPRQLSIDAGQVENLAHCWLRETPDVVLTSNDVTIIDGGTSDLAQRSNPVFTLYDAQRKAGLGYWPAYARPLDGFLPAPIRQ